MDDFRGEAAEKGSRKGKSGGQTIQALLSSAFCFAGKASRDDSCWQSCFPSCSAGIERRGTHTSKCLLDRLPGLLGFSDVVYVAQDGLKVAVHPRQVLLPFLPSARVMAVHQHAQAKGSF